METLNWEDVQDAIKTAPDLKKDPDDALVMQGGFDMFIRTGEPLPDALFPMTADIEAQFRKVYPTLRIVGEESQKEFREGYPRYWGHIYGSGEEGVALQLNMLGFDMRPEMKDLPTLPKFTGIFPLGAEYDAQTRKAVAAIWKYIRCFEYVFRGKDCQIPAQKWEEQDLFLLRSGKAVASGKYALREAGIPVEPKPIVLMTSGILI